jgi:hypothetical protein
VTPKSSRKKPLKEGRDPHNRGLSLGNEIVLAARHVDFVDDVRRYLIKN